jgi:acyl-CoA reductase-like NAD-dependent aldehyde dehydrogenase
LTTTLESIEEGLMTLQASKDAWTKTDIDERISILDEIRRDLLAVSEDWVKICVDEKGIAPNTFGEVFEWNMLQTIFSLLATLCQSLMDIRSSGRPRIAGSLTEGPEGQVIAKVFPRTRLEGMLFQDLTMEVWMEPGVSVDETLQSQARVYREKPGQGGISLVLGAGNASALQVADLLYKLYIKNHVVILKMNPVNAYLKPTLEKAFNALIRRGFLQVVSGGVDEGSYLCHHPSVNDIHLTGSDKTFEAIVFGPGVEGAMRKEEKSPLITKPITGELGNITPIIVVPGPWSRDDIRKQAVKIVSWLALNAGCNCFSPRMIVQHKNWEHREALLEAVGDVMKNLETFKSYYPGSEEKHSIFVSEHPDALRFSDAREGHLPWTLIENINPSNVDDVCFNTEAFSSLIGETALESDSVPEFIDRAVEFVNDTLWGTLTVTILAHPKSLQEPDMKASVERAIRNLRYGTISVNELGVMSYFPGVGPWGGFPGHDIYDIQSGIGAINNYLMFEKPEKMVMYGPFTKMDPQLVSFRHSVEFARKYTYYLAEPSFTGLLGVIWTLMRG